MYLKKKKSFFFIWDELVIVILFLSVKHSAPTDNYYLLLPVLKNSGWTLFTTLCLIFSCFSGMAVLNKFKVMPLNHLRFWETSRLLPHLPMYLWSHLNFWMACCLLLLYPFTSFILRSLTILLTIKKQILSFHMFTFSFIFLFVFVCGKDRLIFLTHREQILCFLNASLHPSFWSCWRYMK